MSQISPIQDTSNTYLSWLNGRFGQCPTMPTYDTHLCPERWKIGKYPTTEESSLEKWPPTWPQDWHEIPMLTNEVAYLHAAQCLNKTTRIICSRQTYFVFHVSQNKTRTSERGILFVVFFCCFLCARIQRLLRLWQRRLSCSFGTGFAWMLAVWTFYALHHWTRKRDYR